MLQDGVLAGRVGGVAALQGRGQVVPVQPQRPIQVCGKEQRAKPVIGVMSHGMVEGGSPSHARARLSS
jgi:hypothetical protein